MKIGTKSPGLGGKKAVRQMRGPGMNKGLKKPRHAKFYSENGENGGKSAGKGTKSSTKGEKSSSYLGGSMSSGVENPRSSGAPGKQLFSKIFRSAS